MRALSNCYQQLEALPQGRLRRKALAPQAPLFAGSGFIHQAWKENPATVEQALLLRDAALTVASWTMHRNNFFKEFPWVLARLIDDRVEPNEKAIVERQLFTAPECKVEKLFSMKLRHAMEADPRTHRLLREPFWQGFLTEWARRVRLASGPVECRHAANRSKNDPSSSWESFSASYVNREAGSIARHDHGIAMAMGGHGPNVPNGSSAQQPAIQRPAPKQQVVKKKSPLLYFHQRCVQRDKVLWLLAGVADMGVRGVRPGWGGSVGLLSSSVLASAFGCESGSAREQHMCLSCRRCQWGTPFT